MMHNQRNGHCKCKVDDGDAVFDCCHQTAVVNSAWQDDISVFFRLIINDICIYATYQRCDAIDAVILQTGSTNSSNDGFKSAC